MRTEAGYGDVYSIPLHIEKDKQGLTKYIEVSCRQDGLGKAFLRICSLTQSSTKELGVTCWKEDSRGIQAGKCKTKAQLYSRSHVSVEEAHIFVWPCVHGIAHRGMESG